MNIKTYNNIRFTPKGDTEVNWNKAMGFIPLDKEIIIYKPDEKNPNIRMKIGDGVTPVQDLPFLKSGVGNAGENGAEIFNSMENIASGALSHAEGNKNTASGFAAHSEGSENIAAGDGSHAEGVGNNISANAVGAHVEGANNTVTAERSHAEGLLNTVSGLGGHVEGYENNATNFASHAEGVNTNATGTAAHSEGVRSAAQGEHSHAEGTDTIAFGITSHAEGMATLAQGAAAHAEGVNTKATGEQSHTEGFNTVASGDSSHAEGVNTTATNDATHAEGVSTQATGLHSHAEGNNTTASGTQSHAEGNNTVASGYGAHAQNIDTTASNDATTAVGFKTKASGIHQFVGGRYNIEDTNNKYAFIIGNGDDNGRSNALSVDWDGNVWCDEKISCNEVTIRLPIDKRLVMDITVISSNASRQGNFFKEPLKLHKTYAVTINDSTYNCNAKSAQILESGGYTHPIYYLGNLALYGGMLVHSSINTGENFLILYQLDDYNYPVTIYNFSSNSIDMTVFEYQDEEEIDLYEYVKALEEGIDDVIKDITSSSNGIVQNITTNTSGDIVITANLDSETTNIIIKQPKNIIKNISTNSDGNIVMTIESGSDINTFTIKQPKNIIKNISTNGDGNIVMAIESGSNTNTFTIKQKYNTSDLTDGAGLGKKTSSSNKLNTKMYLISAQNQNANGETTYSNQNCYIGTDNSLYSNGEKVLTSTNSLLAINKGGTGYTSIEDTTYNVARYRASTLVSNEAQITSNINGTIHWIYE